MTVEKDLGDALLANAAVVALVGASGVYLDEVDEGKARPYVVFAKTASNKERNLLGEVQHESARFEVQCVGDTRASAVALAAAVNAALDDVGQLSDETLSAYDETTGAEIETVVVDWWT